MASPQLEDGYIRLARELCTALTKFELSGPELRVSLAVIGKTYGWNKKEDQISLSQFVQLTGMTKTRIIRAIKVLVRSGVLGSIKGDTSVSSTYWIIKDYDKWKLSSIKRDTSISSDTRPSIKTVQKLVSPVIHTINNTKDILKTAKSNKPKIAFQKPTVDQIQDYCRERSNGIDGQYFFDKMEIVGWVYGKHKTPVKDWKACIRTWEKFNNQWQQEEQREITLG